MRHALAAIAAACLFSGHASAASLPAATAGQLVAQAKAAQAGDDVVMTASADYGLLKFYLVNKTAEVVIHPGPGVAAKATISVQSSANLTFRGFEVPVAASITGASISGSRIRLEGLQIHGTADVFGSKGVSVRNCTGCAVTGNRLQFLYTGIAQLDNDTLLIADNDLRDLHGDGIRGGGTSRLTIARNFLTDLYRIDANHPDAIQNWTTNTTAPVVDLVVEGNTYIRGKGDPAQGGFFGDEKKLGYQNARITGNAFIGGMYHALTIYNATNPTVRDNLIYGWNDSLDSTGKVMVPWIMLSACKGADWGDNRATKFSATGCDPAPAPSSSNVVIPMTEGFDLAPYEAWTHRNDPPVAAASVDDQLAAAQAAIVELQGQVADLKTQLATLAAERDAALVRAAAAEAQSATTQAGLQAAAAARDAALARIAAGLAALSAVAP